MQEQDRLVIQQREERGLSVHAGCARVGPEREMGMWGSAAGPHREARSGKRAARLLGCEEGVVQCASLGCQREIEGGGEQRVSIFSFSIYFTKPISIMNQIKFKYYFQYTFQFK